uniref:Putative LAGLIDADG homing endonuclease n=1 Tax=Oogamochlamys gigantea TaxID=158507 RepID=A0A0S2LNU7_9CHLO|nr:putative LAGLIDADG homing endonuclease [Oogamochlamys gigantea]ALO62840.1 putative LAGLIDADG homing endonuclease [Oogamochlamys gigantea]
MTHNRKEEQWNNWLAGIVDGDGYFYINKKEKSISFEITTHTCDAKVLYQIKNKLKAGSVKARSNSNSVRYRVKQKDIILVIVNKLNGRLYHKPRLEQFGKVCEMLGVPPSKSSSLLHKDNAYFSGLIDSDGTINISVSKTSAEDSQKSGNFGKIQQLIKSKAHNQLSLKITSVDQGFIDFVNKSLGFGTVYTEKPNKKKKSSNAKYHWTIRSFEEFAILYEIIKKYPLRSVKMHRLRLAFLYFKYKELKYHLKSPETIEYKKWEKFCQSWYKYSF